LKGKYFNKLILGLIILIPIFCLGIFNSNVSLQYETNNPGDCILMMFRKKIIKA